MSDQHGIPDGWSRRHFLKSAAGLFLMNSAIGTAGPGQMRSEQAKRQKLNVLFFASSKESVGKNAAKISQDPRLY